MIKSKPLLTIITPTFNRGYIIEKPYESLKRQTDKTFVWLIVDDGSTDDTEEKVKVFQHDAPFEINYIKQANGGKHRALNTGIRIIDTVLTLILDSDDELKPDAVEVINYYWKKVSNNTDIAYMSFLREYPDGRIIGDKYPKDEMISDHITLCMNGNIGGDKSEAYRSQILKENPFPEIEGEHFLSEGVIWNRIGKKNLVFYINRPIYVTEYLEDGLTHSSMKLRLKNPIGAMMFADECQSSEYNVKNRIKYAILFDLFYISARNQKKTNFAATFSFLKLIVFPVSVFYYIKLKLSGIC